MIASSDVTLLGIPDKTKAMHDPNARQTSSGFETSRLSVRPWRDDLDNDPRRENLYKELAAILTPDVLRHLPEPLQITDAPDAITRWVADRDAESDVYTVHAQGPDTLLGLLILVEFPEPDAGGTRHTIHLGFLFAENQWGKGYASELIDGLVHWTQNRNHRVQLLGGVAKDNPASARVLQKAGFVRIAEMSDDETDMFGMQSEAAPLSHKAESPK